MLGGVVLIAVQLNDEGDVVQLSPPATMTIGAQDGARSTGVQEAYGQLSGAGFDASISGEIIARMWQKWVFIATISAMTCLMRAEVGDIVAVPGGRDLGPARITTSVTPAVSGFTPTSGAAGTTVTITGRSLSNASAVAFDGTPAVIVSDTTTQIVTEVPSGTATGRITVTTPDGTATSRASFTMS
ncbi:MAG: IPT/TIG domain-containing protein [Streptosporangiaceae bacterium]